MIGYVLQAFPLSENLTVGAESRKYQIDSAIMSTVILDLQPFNQVNRYKNWMCGKNVWTCLSQGWFPNADLDLGPIVHTQLRLVLQGSPCQGVCNVTLLASLNIFSFLDLRQGKSNYRAVHSEGASGICKPGFRWLVHSPPWLQGYMGAIASKCRNKLATI